MPPCTVLRHEAPPGGGIDWWDLTGVIPSPLIANGALTGGIADAQNVAITSTPAGPITVAATVAAAPTTGFMQLTIGDMASSMQYAVFSYDANDGAVYGWTPTGCTAEDTQVPPARSHPGTASA